MSRYIDADKIPYHDLSDGRGVCEVAFLTDIVRVPSAEVVSKKRAIEALKAIKYGLWEIDIPSPTVPEYVEHHGQIQDMMGVVDNWIKIIEEQEHE